MSGFVSTMAALISSRRARRGGPTVIEIEHKQSLPRSRLVHHLTHTSALTSVNRSGPTVIGQLFTTSATFLLFLGSSAGATTFSPSPFG